MSHIHTDSADDRTYSDDGELLLCEGELFAKVEGGGIIYTCTHCDMIFTTAEECDEVSK